MEHSAWTSQDYDAADQLILLSWRSYQERIAQSASASPLEAVPTPSEREAASAIAALQDDVAIRVLRAYYLGRDGQVSAALTGDGARASLAQKVAALYRFLPAGIPRD